MLPYKVQRLEVCLVMMPFLSEKDTIWEEMGSLSVMFTERLWPGSQHLVGT